VAGTNGKQKTARDMILSMGVIVLVAGFVYLFIPHDDSPRDAKAVDYRVELLTARRAASYPVAAPEGLADSWKATSVRYQGDDFDAWHLGFHDPEGEYVAVEQSTQRRPVFLDEATQGAQERPDVDPLRGRPVRRAGPRGHQGLDNGRDGHRVVRAADEDGAGAENGVRPPALCPRKRGLSP
jgi:choline dehydrogenase-like flavoprotein